MRAVADEEGPLGGTAARLAEYLASGATHGARVEITFASRARFATSAGPDASLLAAAPTFRWFCTVKAVLAYSLLRLLREASCGPDTLVCTLVPEYEGDRREEVQVGHLLTHSSGLPPYPKPSPTCSLGEAALTTPVEATPGSTVAYNYCTAWMIVAHLIEVLSGKEVGAAVERNVFGRLGLRDAALSGRGREDLVARVASVAAPGPEERRVAQLTAPDSLAAMAAWNGGLGTLGDLVGVFAHLLRVRCGNVGDEIDRAVVEDLTTAPERRYDEVLERRVAYANGTIADVSTAGFGRGWSSDSFGIGGSVLNRPLAAVWADVERQVACGVMLSGASGKNVIYLQRIASQVRSDVDAWA